MKRLAIILTVTALCAITSMSQKTSDKKPDAEALVYTELAQKLKAGDASIDFKKLRIGFSHTKDYSPYGGDREGRKAAFDAIDKKNYKDAVKKAEDMLSDNCTDMDAHVAASIAYEGLGDAEKAALHKNIYIGLVNSILDSGDGKTAATAYVVITTSEEYSVLRALGLAPAGQALQQAEGHSFDVLTATDPETKKSTKIYFNIDIVWKGETDMFK